MKKTLPSVRKSKKGNGIKFMPDSLFTPEWKGGQEAAYLRSSAAEHNRAFAARVQAEKDAIEDRIRFQKEWDWVEERLKIFFSQRDDRQKAGRLLDITITSDTKRDVTTEKAALVKAAQRGQRVSVCRFAWDISGNCSNGYTRTIAYPDGLFTKQIAERLKLGSRRYSYYVDLTTRCRECEYCLRHRAGLWRVRVRQETMAAARTWFGTLTLRPDRHFHYLTVARSESAKKGIHFDALPESERFALVHKHIAREITLSIKRIRKATAVPFKYIIVAEAHKSGLPHYHMLIHERKFGEPLRYAELRKFWHHGFQEWKLVADERSATYLCKYLSKSMLARVRASSRYGASIAPDHL